MWDTVVQPAIIAVLVVLEVAVWQVRMTVAARGRKRSAAALGALNAVIQVVALGQVVTNLDRPANVVGYALGVAIGVYVGVAAGGRLAAEPVEHRIVVPGDGAGLSAVLRAGGWPVTVQPVHGPDGPAAALSVVVAGGRSAEVERALAGIDHGGLHTSSRLRTANWAAPEPVELRSA
jgi:uncharacterized protein YebE (UPF0316 family)